MVGEGSQWLTLKMAWHSALNMSKHSGEMGGGERVCCVIIHLTEKLIK